MPFDFTNNEQATQLLIDGKRRIEICGWLQGDYISYEGRVCMLGAIGGRTENETDDDDFSDPVIALAADRLFAVIGQDVHSWNDAPERTIGEVYAAFDRAISASLSD